MWWHVPRPRRHRRQLGRGVWAAVQLLSRFALSHASATRSCWLHIRCSVTTMAYLQLTDDAFLAVQDIPAEWRMWLRKLREDPPNDEELQQ